MTDSVRIQIGDAIQRGNVDEVRKWLEANPGAITDYAFTAVPGDTPLYMAWVLRNADIIGLLIQHGVDPSAPDTRGSTTLHRACEECQSKSDIELVILLAKSGDIDSVNEEGDTPLVIALRNGDEKLAAALLDLGADPNIPSAEGFSPLDLVGNDEEEIWTLMERKGASRDFFTSCASGDVASVVHAIKQNPEVVTTRGRDGMTVLHIACLYDQTKIVRILLESSADPNAVDELGRTPLFLANEEIISLLAASGANMNAENKMDETALMNAQTPSIVLALLKNGASINHRNRICETALHVQEVVDCMQCLLEHGADVHARDHDQFTPLEVWARVRWEEQCSLLLKFGADPAPLFKPIRECLSSGQIDHAFYEKELVEVFRKGGYEEEAIRRLFEAHNWDYPKAMTESEKKDTDRGNL